MKDFPEFMKNPKNKIKQSSQYTQGIEGFVFDGMDGSGKGTQLKFLEKELGDKVVFKKYSPDEVKVDDTDYLVLSESDIIAVIE